MKKKSALVFGLVLVILLSLGSGIVIGQTSSELPRVEMACENKAGLIHGFDDGFSILKKCPKSSRKVVLGSVSTGNSGGGLEAGEVSFISYSEEKDQVYVLDKNGKAWFYKINDDPVLFQRYSSLDLPTGVNINDVVGWNQGSFILKNGNVYVNTGEGGWMLVGFGTEE